jgi:predicted transcriptional regulator YheO
MTKLKEKTRPRVKDRQTAKKNTTLKDSKSKSHADIVLDAMRPVVHMIAESIGRTSEVILHDFRTPDASVIEIAGNLTNREIGAPVNEINKWLLSQGKDVRDKTEKFIRTGRGRTLKTARTLFRESDGRAFGALCINIDVTELLSVARNIADLAGSDELFQEQPRLVDDIAYVVQAVVAAEEARTGARPDIGTPADRVRVFRALQDQGVFTLRRAVPRVAEYFGVSRATIYSYLNEVNGSANRD